VLAQDARQPDGVVGGPRPAIVHPVGRRHPDDHRLAGREGGAHGVHDLDDQPDAVLERTAVTVGPLVRQRRQELVQQVAVRGVHLDDVEAGLVGPARARGERIDDAGDLGGVHRAGLCEAGEGHVARADDRPAAVCGRDDTAGLTGEVPVRARLAARVRELHRGRRPL
jgi:hypothetical protein